MELQVLEFYPAFPEVTVCDIKRFALSKAGQSLDPALLEERFRLFRDAG